MKRLKTLFILASILIVTCSCDLQPTGNKTERSSNHKTELKNITKGDFIVGFSHTLNRGAEFAIYKENGSIQYSILIKDAVNLSTSSYNKDDTFFLQTEAITILWSITKLGVLRNLMIKACLKQPKMKELFH